MGKDWKQLRKQEQLAEELGDWERLEELRKKQEMWEEKGKRKREIKEEEDDPDVKR